MKALLFIVLMVVLKRRSELDCHTHRAVGCLHLLYCLDLHSVWSSAPSSASTDVFVVIAGIATSPAPAAVAKVGLLNARLMVNSGSLVQDIMLSQNLDVLVVTETWIARDDPDAVKLNTATADYVISHLSRPTSTVRSRGGASVSFTEIPLSSNISRYSSLFTISHLNASCCPSSRQRRDMIVPTSIFQSDCVLR